MEITISNCRPGKTVDPALETTVRTVLAKTAEVYGLKENTEVSVVLADDPYIHELNLQYRGKDRPTDVLSFALNEGEEPEIVADADLTPTVLLGDIVISLETAARQAEEYNHGLEREVAYLTVHGMMHLLGYDHETEEEREEMRGEEEHVLQLLGIGR
ncbi:MAG TPA: rRNA maturation RNase YbeY [Patescibacteria group bacterium]|nr:rRNA maturation RNase YbeY [Patescibacteria group bacterium]